MRSLLDLCIDAVLRYRLPTDRIPDDLVERIREERVIQEAFRAHRKRMVHVFRKIEWFEELHVYDASYMIPVCHELLLVNRWLRTLRL